MQRIRQQVDQLQQQLAGLTRAQKVLAVALVAIMIAAVLWWGRRAATDEMVALFDEPLGTQGAADVRSMLSGRGIEHEMHDGQIFVSSEQREEAIAALAWERTRDAGRSTPLAEAIEKIGAFDAHQKIEARLTQARCDELKRTIEKIPGVRSASLHLNTTYKRQIGESLLPSASVAIDTTGEVDVRHMAQATSCLLADSVSGLEPENVTVLIDGRLINVGGDDVLGGAGFLEMSRIVEQHFSAKVREAVGAIPGLTVSVAVDFDDTANSHSLPKGENDVPLPAPPAERLTAGEMAVGPLTLGDIAAVLGAPPGNQARAGNVTPDAPETDMSPAKPTPTGCTLIVPGSWIIQQWQSRNRTSELPEADVLAQFLREKREELCRAASIALGGLSQEGVAVIVDEDSGLIPGEEAPAVSLSGAHESSGISALIRDHGREVAVAALAAVSVLLIGAMLKQGGSGAVSISAVEGSLAMYGGEHLGEFYGELDALDACALDGQSLEQVQTMVKTDPAAAAAIVRRWLGA